MDISIIIPVYNTEGYLRRCLRSVVNQTIQNYEIIIVNDGSTDSSLSICEDFAARFPNISIITQINEGQGVARNRALIQAKGKYIVFVDSDDYYTDEAHCLNLYNKMENLNLDLVISKRIIPNCEKMQESDILTKLYKGKVLGKKEVMEAHALDLIHHAPTAKMYKKSILLDNNIQFSKEIPGEDIVFSMKLYEFGNRFLILDDASYFYEQHVHSSTNNSIYMATIKSPIHGLNWMLQFGGGIENFARIGKGLVEERYLKLYKDRCINLFLQSYFNYQYCWFNMLVATGEIYKAGQFCFFGASKGAEEYVGNLPANKEGFFLVDNNEKLHGKKYMSYSIYPPDALKNAKDCHIIVTSMYFKEITEQLTEMGVIEDMGGVMPYGGSTELEQVYIKGLSRLFSIE